MNDRAMKAVVGLLVLACFAAGQAGCGLLQFAPLLILVLPEDEEEEPTPPPPPPTSPLITGVAPSSGPETGGTTVIVSGLRFQNGCTVFFGAGSAGVSFVSDTELTCTTPSAPSPGAVDVTVTNPDTQDHTLPGAFTYTDATPPGDVGNFAAVVRIAAREIDLSWTPPGDTDYAGVVIRRRSDAYPTSATDGALVYVGAGTSITDPVHADGTFYYTAFAYDGVPNYSGGVQQSGSIDTTPPGEVTGFVAAQGPGQVTLSWTNPGDADFQGVMIRRSHTAYPATTSDGTLIYTGTVSPQVDSPLTDLRTYYYTAFTFDGIPNYSAGANASATISADTVALAVGWVGTGNSGWVQIDSPTAGASGVAYDYFNNVKGLFVDGQGNIFVADSLNHRVSKWDASGAPVGWIGDGSDGWKITAASGSAGSGPRDFDNPIDVFVTSAGNVYVADYVNDRICKWDGGGNLVGYIGCGQDGWQTTGSGGGNALKQFDGPMGVFVDGAGKIYVADNLNNRVVRWDDATGVAEVWLGGGADGWQTSAGATSGNDQRSLNGPGDVFVDGTGTIYVADRFNHRISRWNSSAAAQGWIGGGSGSWQTTAGASSGTGASSFNRPSGVWVDDRGCLFVADCLNFRICRWDASAGTPVGWIGGDSDGWKTTAAPSALSRHYNGFSYVYGVFVDGSGNLFACDGGNSRICKWFD